jgi:hypothetical protein
VKPPEQRQVPAAQSPCLLATTLIPVLTPAEYVLEPGLGGGVVSALGLQRGLSLTINTCVCKAGVADTRELMFFRVTVTWGLS